jgi:5'-methylthioadenosine phosphorylase
MERGRPRAQVRTAARRDRHGKPERDADTEDGDGAMDRLGIVGGSAFREALPGGLDARTVETAAGGVRVHEGEGYVFISRHGDDGRRQAHRVAHVAHALALTRLGVEAAVGFCSVGSLSAGLSPGAVVVPDDYLSLQPPPTSAGDDERLHIVPALDAALRERLLRAARATDGPVRDGGVYAETRGPRFETRAEIRLLADYAHVVGMTGASEATIFQERGLAYAILAIVDNLAHGIGDEPLTIEGFERQLARGAERARHILHALVRP